jgi:hypothetical protein
VVYGQDALAIGADRRRAGGRDRRRAASVEPLPDGRIGHLAQRILAHVAALVPD